MLDQRDRRVDDGGVDLCGRVNVGAHVLVVRLKGSLGWLRRGLRRRVKYEGEEEEEVEGCHGDTLGSSEMTRLVGIVRFETGFPNEEATS